MLNKYFLYCFVSNKMPLKLGGTRLIHKSSIYQLKNDIPNFTPNMKRVIVKKHLEVYTDSGIALLRTKIS